MAINTRVNEAIHDSIIFYPSVLLAFISEVMLIRH